MSIVILGASGGTGLATVAAALSAGLAVTAVVRNPARLPQELRDRADVTLQTADARDIDALARAFEGADAVISCIGPVRGADDPTILRDGARATLAAAARVGSTRLVFVSASGWVVDGDDPVTRYLAKPILRRLLRTVNLDFAAMESIIRASALDWTIVRPPRLVDGKAKGRIRSRLDGNVRWGFQIRRADLGEFLVHAAADPTLGRATVSVSN